MCETGENSHSLLTYIIMEQVVEFNQHNTKIAPQPFYKYFFEVRIEETCSLEKVVEMIFPIQKLWNR